MFSVTPFAGVTVQLTTFTVMPAQAGIPLS
jgi:hypothetical protein